MTFPTREVTTRLIDGEVIFRSREVYGRNEPEEAAICCFESGFAGKKLLSSSLCKATSLRISLLDQIASHSKILSYAISPLQQEIRVWYL
jgi:hypothetical protein